MVSLVMRAAVLWASLCGYFVLAKKKNIDMAFAPIVVTSSIGVLIFFAGLLNIMPLMTYAICIGGIAIGIYLRPWRMISSKEISKRDIVCISVFTAICLLFAIRLKGVMGLHYDNFSHWLTVITEMVKTNQMPNFNSNLIYFPSYPTGSAGYAYYFCKIFNHFDDGVMLFAQSTLLAACITCFLAYIKKVNVFSICVFLAGSMYCLVANIAIDQLLVDTLISVLGIAAVAIVIYYNDNLIRAAAWSAPIQIFLITVKNSGIVFVLFTFALLIVLSVLSDINSKSRFSIKRAARISYISLGLPLFVLLLWNKHVDYVFTNGSISKHSMRLENYMSVLGDKSFDTIKEILQNFANRFFAPSSAWLVLTIVAAVLILGYVSKRLIENGNKKTELLILGGIIVVYGGFMVVLALMYLLSMPAGEAVKLASYDRYEKQVLLYIVGAATVYSLWRFETIPKERAGYVIKLLSTLAFCFVVVIELHSIPSLLINTNDYSGSDREWFTNVRDLYSLPEKSKYFIYGNSDTNDYTRFLSRYVLWSANVTTCRPDELPVKASAMDRYDFLIVMQSDDNFDALLSEKGMPLNEVVYQLSDYQ